MHLSTLESTHDLWEERANKVLSHFSFNEPDEIDLYEICWSYGINVKPLDLNYIHETEYFEGINNLKAYSLPKGKARRGTIYLQPELETVEKKLLLTEEFCHLYSHHISQLSANSIVLAKTENQAKRMAAYLLMPKKFIRRVLDFSLEHPVLISDIADYFVVSEEFAQYRMELAYNRKIDALISYKGKMGSYSICD